MTYSLRTVFTLFSLLCVVVELTAQEKEPVREGRDHSIVVDSEGAELGRMTTILRFWPTGSENRYLYRSVSGDELVIESSIDNSSQEQEEIIRDARGDAWIAARFTNPFVGRDIGEVVRAHPHGLDMPEQMVLETKAGEWHGTLTGWESPDTRLRLTADLRRSLSFSLLEMIEREVGGVFAMEQLGMVKMRILEYLLYRPECTPEPSTVTLTTPDCFFDASFGFPCSEEQRERVRRATEAGSAPEWY